MSAIRRRTKADILDSEEEVAEEVFAIPRPDGTVSKDKVCVLCCVWLLLSGFLL